MEMKSDDKLDYFDHFHETDLRVYWNCYFTKIYEEHPILEYIFFNHSILFNNCIKYCKTQT